MANPDGDLDIGLFVYKDASKPRVKGLNKNNCGPRIYDMYMCDGINQKLCRRN